MKKLTTIFALMMAFGLVACEEKAPAGGDNAAVKAEVAKEITADNADEKAAELEKELEAELAAEGE